LKVGFIGLGNMGGPLAQRLIGKVDLSVFDLDETRVQAFVAEGARGAMTAAELASEVDLVLTCLPSSNEVREVLLGAGGVASALSAGTMVADMTTGDPEATRDMAATLKERNIEMLDAPVSGGPRGAREGTIAIMVGGSSEGFERLTKTLDLISINVMHAGDLGSGHAVKAGNNLLNLICRMASFEVVSMLVKDGVAPERAVEIMQKSSGRNYALEITLPDNILSGKMMQGFTTALMRKDSGVALDIAAAHSLEMPLGELARGLLQNTIDEHGQDADMSAVALNYERSTGARLRPDDEVVTPN
jgi:3-hydroxyisobutyrate dehydrogenase